MLTVGAILFGLLIALPASLAARQVGRRHERQVEQQNALKRQLLEAEHARKTQELEEARQLQLSMLPKTVPEHPVVELAAYMTTATEVGGDYYDFDVADDGTLTIAIGDATGHGAQAGTMVTATKSLFNLLAKEPDLEHVLKKATVALKRMAFPRLYMALALGRLRGPTLELIGAGMPPALIYRAADGSVETVPLKGMPLGSLVDFPYRTTQRHGAQAGTMVTATKSLFNLLAKEPDLEHVLKKATVALKRMAFPRLYMALALGRLRGPTLELIGAGMPPALIYRAADGSVETVPLKGMPLGSFVDFPYRTTRTDLAPGDTVMLMSDGFPELFNSQQEMLGYDRARTVFEEIAHRRPEEIIDHFVRTAAIWTNDQAPADEAAYDDDMTFIVMKVKGSPHSS